MKLAFMSSVCPKMSLAELIAAAKTYGYRGLEFRPEWQHGHGIELSASDAQRSDARRQLKDAGIEPCCISPGSRFHHAEASQREEELSRLLRYIDLANEMGIPCIRIFGDPLPNGGDGQRPAAYQQLAHYMGKAAERAAGAGIKLVVETHLNFRAFDAGEVMYRAAYPPALWVNWDLGHCLRHGEDVDEAYRHIKGRVAHAHMSLDDKDSEIPLLGRQMRLLHDEGYSRYFSVEVINPPESLPVLIRYAAAWKRIQAAAGI